MRDLPFDDPLERFTGFLQQHFYSSVEIATAQDVSLHDSFPCLAAHVGTPILSARPDESISEAICDHLLEPLPAREQNFFDLTIRDRLVEAVDAQINGRNRLGPFESETFMGYGIGTCAPMQIGVDRASDQPLNLEQLATNMRSLAERMVVPMQNMATSMEAAGRAFGRALREAISHLPDPNPLHLWAASDLPMMPVYEGFPGVSTLLEDLRELAPVLAADNPNMLHRMGEDDHRAYRRVQRDIVDHYRVPEVPWMALFCDCGRTYQILATRESGECVGCQCGKSWNLFEIEWERFGE